MGVAALWGVPVIAALAGFALILAVLGWLLWWVLTEPLRRRRPLPMYREYRDEWAKYREEAS